jgi:hypothetical protein
VPPKMTFGLSEERIWGFETNGDKERGKAEHVKEGVIGCRSRLEMCAYEKIPQIDNAERGLRKFPRSFGCCIGTFNAK